MPLLSFTSRYAFSRNPIILDLTESEWAALYDLPDSSKGIPYAITLGGAEVYSGKLYPPCRIDISEIIDDHIEPFPEPSGAGPVIPILDQGEMTPYLVGIQIAGDDHTDDPQRSFIALPGGVSRQNLRAYAAAHTDPFTARYLRHTGNFFLTSRAAGWRIAIKETELYPLYFIADKIIPDLSARSHISGKTIALGSADPGINALDIDSLRRSFLGTHAEIPSVFDILKGDALACRIVIEQATAEKNRCRLKFRNALGVHEIVELSGEITVEPGDRADDGDTTYLSYDSTVGGFRKNAPRVERGITLSVETTVRSRSELEYLLGAVSSDDVMLLDYAAAPVKVLPSVDSLSYTHRLEAPQRIKVSLTLADSDLLPMPDIDTADASVKPRIFTPHFSDHFN